MKRKGYSLFNFIHAWICLHVFSIPLPYPIPRKYKDKIKLAQAHLLKIRHKKICQQTPRPHVIHIFKPKGPSKGNLLVTHGWMSKSVYMIGIIDALYCAGYTIYAIDFPAHGESKGVQVKWFESVQAIIEAQKNFGPFDVAIGHSYGGSMLLCAFCLIESFQVKPFNKIALISAPTTITLPIKRAARSFKLNRFSYRLFRGWMRNEHAFDIKLIRPYEKAKADKTRFIIIHGADDNSVPIQESIRFCKDNANAKLQLLPKLDHVNVLFSDQTYQALLSFIEPVK